MWLWFRAWPSTEWCVFGCTCRKKAEDRIRVFDDGQMKVYRN